MDENFTQSLPKSVDSTKPCNQRVLNRHEATLEFIRQFARSYYPSQVTSMATTPAIVLN